MIIFRCQANSHIGMGHLVRCRVLARNLRHRGFQSIMVGPSHNFIQRDDFFLFKEWIERPEWSTPEIEADFISGVANVHQAHHIIIDDYRSDSAHQLLLRKAGFRCLQQYDASKSQSFAAQLVINSSPAERRSFYEASLTARPVDMLHGPSYSILRPEFLAKKPPSFEPICKRLFISFGGGDDRGGILFALKVLIDKLPVSISLELMIGQHNPNLENIRAWLAKSSVSNINLHVNPKDVPSLLMSCQLAILSGGTTTFEAAYCGLPMILMPIVSNQERQGEGWENVGAAICLGPLEYVSGQRLLTQVKTLIKTPHLRQTMALKGQMLVDGLGVDRIIDRLLAKENNMINSTNDLASVKTQTILVLGTNAGQADLIRHMKTRGWKVVACAHMAGGPGEALSDEFHLVDIMDVDAVTELAAKVNADIVYSISSDIAITSAVSVAENLGIAHFYNTDLIDFFNQKPRMRAFLNKNDLGFVPYQRVEKLEDVHNWDTFPCMVKPSDSQGQKGVQRIDNTKDLPEAIRFALTASTQSGTAIVEAFLEGVEVSCNILVQNGKIVFDVLSERLTYEGALTGVPRGHLVPCVNLTDGETRATLKLVHETVKALKIKDGCLYFQMKVTPEGPRIIEIAPRLDGCHMWRLIHHATQENFLENTINTLIKKTCAVKTSPRTKLGDCYELMFQQTPPGTVFDTKKFPIPKDALYHEYRYFNGQTVQAINGKMENVGYYIRKLTPAIIRAHKIS